MTIADIRNRAGGTASATDSFLISARASLKPTGPPVEAPINVMQRTRRARQPTVNVPSDKMAAFLVEVKNAKLRRTTNSASQPTMTARSSSGPRRVPEAGNITISGASSRDILLELARNRVSSLKRKRGNETGIDIDDIPAKRRFKETRSSTSESSQSSVASTASIPTSFNSQSTQATTFSFFDQTWPSTSTVETDGTTPSLCSDNEEEDEPSSGLPLPPTPPRRREESEEHAILEVEDHAVARTPPSFSRSPTPQLPDEQPQPVVPRLPREINLLEMRKRVPSSPMPSSTPKKPLPPARTRVVSKTQPSRVPNYDSDDNPLSFSPPSLRAAPAAPPPSRIPRKADNKPTSQALSSRPTRDMGVSSTNRNEPVSQPQPTAGPSNHVKRRQTLDEELRRLGDELWEDHDADQGGEQGLESGALLGTGSRSTRKGFLSGGGAGGIPVFMGSGYVVGAEEDGVPQRQRSRSTSRSSRR